MNAHVGTVTREHKLRWLSHLGDDLMTWNPDDPASVRAAQQKFAELRSQGYAAFRMDVVEQNGVMRERKSEQLVRDFDPEAGHYMMVPGRQGG